MASVNKIHLLGNCGQDPTIRYSASGMAMCSFSLATSTKRKDKNTGDMVEETSWHRIQLFDKLAEIASQYVKKGKPVYIEGRIKYGKFTDQAGVEKNIVDIVAESMQLLGGRDDDQGGRQQEQRPQQEQGGYRNSGGRPAPGTAPAPRQAAPQRQDASRQGGGGFEDMDDDIPFANPLRGSARCLAM